MTEDQLAALMLEEAAESHSRRAVITDRPMRTNPKSHKNVTERDAIIARALLDHGPLSRRYILKHYDVSSSALARTLSRIGARTVAIGVYDLPKKLGGHHGST